MAFKVFNSREEAAELKRQARLQQKVQLQTQALVAALRPAGSRSQQKGGTTRTPPGACFKCGAEGHWARQCPTPRAPTRPCPLCHLMGHWKSDCPSLRESSAPQRGGRPETDGLRHTPQPERLQMWWPQSSSSTSSRGLGYPGPYSQTTGRHLSPV
ncbi:serine/arginine-rich splicing factor RS2Z32-like isoform X1 [Canis lupus familiaris]|uniref:serine/arginine-rich splicing factor RS2Z32-like isoform X1 n=1 Tax=Canis lupus familiaris TaxID=9615 RepID=UPI0018F7091D|nr:serine/arginine-rich splicing factor RS2Z32-like isoform X1 [Canis lupus familiaris]